MRIVFMGTPEFAATILDKIIQTNSHQIVGVVTTPDKPAGRGQHVKYSEVKQYALAHQLPLLQPVSLKDETFIESLQKLHADVFVVVAFRMLPKIVYAMPPKGTFNIHASLLPQYRGAAPIQWAIINGEKKTGVTTFFLDEHTDTGAIIHQSEVEITPDETAGTLHDKLMIAGAEIAIKTLHDIERNSITPQPQTNTQTLKSAPKIFKEDMHILWNDTAENIYNKIRGLSPYPAAFTRITPLDSPCSPSEKRIIIKIYQCHITNTLSNKKPGTFTIQENKKLLISTLNYDISIETIQIEGKKRMDIVSFLKGFRVENYTNTLD